MEFCPLPIMVYVLKFSVNYFMAMNAKKSYTYDNMMPLSTENESVGSPKFLDTNNAICSKI